MDSSATLNIYSKSDDSRGRILSNFSHYPFTLDGKHFESVEGFIQGIAFPEDDPVRDATFAKWGSDAKKVEKEQEKKFVWWDGKEIPFGLAEEHALIRRALEAKYEQNPEAKEALLATQGLILTHTLPDSESTDTCLPTKTFCAMLIDIREVYLKNK